MAADLVLACNAGDAAAARRRVRERLRNRRPDSEARGNRLELADARLLAACWHGFESWAELVDHHRPPLKDGPYRLIRHPMYAAALAISLGLACLIQSIAFFSVFCIYVVLILQLVPFEERGLQQAYGEEYAAYRQRTPRLFPFIQ